MPNRKSKRSVKLSLKQLKPRVLLGPSMRVRDVSSNVYTFLYPPLSTSVPFLKNRGLSAKNAFAEHEYVYPRVKADGYCIFHNIKTRECNIHPVKPETCVAGPITFDVNTESGKIELHIKMKKICLLAGVVYKDKALLRQHLKPAKQEILKLLNELSSKELKAILKKEEPETFKIAEEPAEKSVLIKMRQKCS